MEEHKRSGAPAMPVDAYGAGEDLNEVCGAWCEVI